VPYAFAHPAAVIPAHRLLGRYAVASALVVGSLVPDLWYILPGFDRPHTHRALSLLWFCLPAGLLAYIAFHRLLKQPLAALLPASVLARLQPFLAAGLPRRPWRAVVASLLAGSATHLAWDAFTHEGILSRTFPVFNEVALVVGSVELRVLQVLQHGSTLAGAAFVAWWCARWLRNAPHAKVDGSLQLSKLTRGVLVVAIACTALIAFYLSWTGARSGDIETLRPLLRASVLSAAGWAGSVLLAYCAAWRLVRPLIHRSSRRP
jgi:hypothetical protein